MEAVVRAALELFSQKGVKASSVREIAQLAGVNHGLIHRHFGSKEKLRQVVQETLAQEVRDEIGEVLNHQQGVWQAVEALRAHPEFLRVLARTLLDGEPATEVRGPDPYLGRMAAIAAKQQERGALRGDMPPEVMVAGMAALVLGLMVLQNYILPSVGLDKGPPEAVNDSIIEAWLKLLLPMAD